MTSVIDLVAGARPNFTKVAPILRTFHGHAAIVDQFMSGAHKKSQPIDRWFVSGVTPIDELSVPNDLVRLRAKGPSSWTAGSDEVA